MLIETYFITGFMIGFEIVSIDLGDEVEHTVVLDLGIVRLMLTKK